MVFVLQRSQDSVRVGGYRVLTLVVCRVDA